MRQIDGDELKRRLRILGVGFSAARERAYEDVIEMIDCSLEIKMFEPTAQLMTLAEVQDAGYRPLYLETKDGGLQLYCTIHCGMDAKVFLSIGGFEKSQGFEMATYGKEWRMWTWEPTEEQMREAAWEC